MRTATTTSGASSNGSQSSSEKPWPKDPHLGLRFWVQIDGVEIAGFAECSGLTVETEVFEYREGGVNTYVHKLPVRTKYSNVTLKRGIDFGRDLLHWYLKTLDGKTTLPSKGDEEGNRKDTEGRPVRTNVTIALYGPIGDHPVRQWHLRRAFPVKWVGPSMKTDAGAVAVETLEFAHEGLVFGALPHAPQQPPDERYK